MGYREESDYYRARWLEAREENHTLWQYYHRLQRSDLAQHICSELGVLKAGGWTVETVRRILRGKA